jgi:hypothetical protein
VLRHGDRPNRRFVNASVPLHRLSYNALLTSFAAGLQDGLGGKFHGSLK